MKLFILIVPALLLFSGITLHPKEASACAALVLDYHGDGYGWAVDYPTIAEAEEQAHSMVEGYAKTIMTFCGGAGAYAEDSTSDASGWARSENIGEARRLALQNCQRAAGNSVGCDLRVWGQEKPRDPPYRLSRGNNKAAVKACIVNGGIGYQVYVQLTFELSDSPIRANGMTGERDAFFTGHTCMSAQEFQKYGVLDSNLIWSDDVTDERISAVQLITMNGGTTDAGILDLSPVMKRFVDNVVKKHPLYARKQTSPAKYHRGIEALGNSGQFIYIGTIAVLDENLSYQLMRRIIGYQELGPEHGPFHEIVDVGSF